MPARWSPGPRIVALFAALASGIGCTRGDDRVQLSVFAASSLTEAFGALEPAFERAHPHIDAQLVFAGSQVLRLQIEQGAPADVFASANAAHTDALLSAGLLSRSKPFATNELVVITPTGEPTPVATFADLPHARRLVIGNEHVPIGIYTRQLLQRAGARLGEGFSDRVYARVASEEGNVRLVRAKIELGEADAAIVYHTDAVASERVRLVPVPEAIGVSASYLLGPVDRSRSPEAAEQLIAFVRSDEGRAILQHHGFGMEIP